MRVLGVLLGALLALPRRASAPLGLRVMEHASAEHLLEEVKGVEILLVVGEAVAEMAPVEVVVGSPPVDAVGEDVAEAGAALVFASFVGIGQDFVGGRDFFKDFFGGGVDELVGVELESQLAIRARITLR